MLSNMYIYLHIGWNRLQCFLDDATPVHLESERQHVASHPLRQGLLLVGGAELEELLDDVVAEDVGHQAVGRGEDLAEHHGLLLRGCALQLLLDESGK